MASRSRRAFPANLTARRLSIRDINTCYRFGRRIQAERVLVNNYHAYPAHVAFGGFKQSGSRRESHKMTPDHDQQSKNMLVSDKPGFF